VLVQFSAATSSTTEGGAAASVAVELRLAHGPLAVDVVAHVSDAGTGNASSGADYTALAGAPLVFPAGSVNGAQLAVDVSTGQDDLIEGDEAIDLVLSCDNAPAGGSGIHELTIADADHANIAFVQANGGTSAEDAGSIGAQVELTYDAGLTLTVAAEASVAISPSGAALEGSDLALAGAPKVHFAAGAPSGAVRTVTLDLVDDAIPEGDEVAVLALAASGSGVDVSGGATHQFVIADDDVSPDPFLTVESNATGNFLPVDNGDLIDLGDEPIGGPASEGILVRLTNYGVAPLSLGAFLLSGTDPREFDIDLESYSYHDGGESDAGVDVPFPYSSPSIAGDPADIALEPDLGVLAILGSLARVRLHGLALAPGTGEPLVLELERIPLPIRPETAILVDGRPSSEAREELLSTLTIWRGRVSGLADSRVFLCFSPHGSRGWIQLGASPDSRYELFCSPPAGNEPAPPSLIVASAATVAERGADLPPLCAGTREIPGAAPPRPAHDDDGTHASFATATLALESDYQLYQRFGSVPATTTYVTEMVAAVSDRYLVDAEVLLSISYLGIWSNAGDPWTTPDIPGSTLDMLDEFRAAWAPSLGGSWPVAANLAHFLSGANLGGGVAYLDALCSPDYGFGVSANLNGNIDWSSFDGSPSGATWDFVVFAHELGHNFGARHTHDYCPPLDRCQASCEGGAICSEGTLMSYCHLCAGGMRNILLEFHPWVANVIRETAANACLDGTGLALGEELTLRLRFLPTTTTGAKSAILDVDHDARNTTSPFEIVLESLASN
jgi:hypothetical protein